MVAEIKPNQLFTRNATPDDNGVFCGGACVWLIKREGDKTYLLFQKRSMEVHNGGFYDASAGGHIDQGEDALTAALRETKEEIGLSLTPEEVMFVCSYVNNDELTYVYLSDRTGKDDQFTVDKSEVESVEWVSLEDLDTFVPAKVKPTLRSLPQHIPILRLFIEKYLHGDN